MVTPYMAALLVYIGLPVLLFAYCLIRCLWKGGNSRAFVKAFAVLIASSLISFTVLRAEGIWRQRKIEDRMRIFLLQTDGTEFRVAHDSELYQKLTDLNKKVLNDELSFQLLDYSEGYYCMEVRGDGSVLGSVVILDKNAYAIPWSPVDAELQTIVIK